MILHNGELYQDDDSIDCHIALNIDYHHFELARSLELPLPPACYVFVNNHVRTHEQHMICGLYNALLDSARLDKVFISGGGVIG